ncbi:helix-turn-helix domain-containing protein [Streptomyces sp. NPDC005283]|uniref:helix-turn-helix transcriptional regulator n=1 Tax=Streptomyces sp. NPDC005283 TaxID=3156871 RepID=UPI0034534DD9
MQVGLSRPPLPQPRRPKESTVRLLSVREVARRLGVSNGAVYRMIRRGKLPAVHTSAGDRAIRIPEAAVDKIAVEMHRHSDTA